jgi:hypothetical protein
VTVPSKPHLGRDHEDRPSGPGQQAAEGRKQRTVCGPEPRPWVLAARCATLTEYTALWFIANLNPS